MNYVQSLNSTFSNLTQICFKNFLLSARSTIMVVLWWRSGNYSMSMEAREFLMSKNGASGGEIERQDNVDFFFSIWTRGEGLCTLFPSNRHWTKYFIYKFWGDYTTMCAASRWSMAVGPNGFSAMIMRLLAQPSRQVNFRHDALVTIRWISFHAIYFRSSKLKNNGVK